ncbi:FHA domain-containing protein [Myxococcota bacterium]|nr:FHA domain-containing protein [Myxococcota bacterium]
MALLREADTDRLLSPGARCVLGRSRACALVLAEPTVSGEHAVLFQGLDGRWCVRDLGSRNGTFVDGQRITGGGVATLREGAVLRLGARARPWTLVDETGPAAYAVAEDGQVRRALDGVLVLPDDDRPEGWLASSEGVWLWATGEGQERPALGLDEVRAGGQRWWLALPAGEIGDVLVPTMGASMGPDLGQIRLEFRLSHDETFVQLAWRWREEHHEVPARACHRMLLVLARQRLADRAAGLPEGDCGWVHTDRLLEELDASAQKLHVDVLRSRRQLAQMGVTDADALVERRPTTRELRIGVADLSVIASQPAHAASTG